MQTEREAQQQASGKFDGARQVVGSERMPGFFVNSLAIQKARMRLDVKHGPVGSSRVSDR
jgi:hypothetical protein